MTATPEYHSYEEYQNRLHKLSELRSLGIEPYPHKFHNTHSTKALHDLYQGQEVGHSDDAASGVTPLVRVAGRLMLFRAMGKNAFAQLQDGENRIQIMFNRDLTQLAGYQVPNPVTPETLTPFKVIEKKIDLGDIIGVEGNLFYTNKGELTIFAKTVTLLSKSLLPLPDKHSGLADKELRYRKRWLDLISNPEVRNTFYLRSKIFQLIRKYCEELSFIEVETPVLQSIYGGAEARPFTTVLNALEQEMFLRISLEIPLKKLIVGGIERVFEIGKAFRNEGMDRNHNPEFTMIEAYAAYWDYHDTMHFVENMFEMIAQNLFGKTKIPAHIPGKDEIVELEMKAPWPRITMNESLKKYANIDVDIMDNDQMIQMLKESEHCDLKKLKTMSRGLLIAALFGTFVEPHLIQPHFIIDHPIETTPLCKPHRHPEMRKNGIVERFEGFILGQEICNSYSELNDPEIQRKLLEIQSARKDAGDEEASPLDEEFIEAICQGMPPTGGVGIGLDRLVMLFTDSHSIRDVLYFPWMKPL